MLRPASLLLLIPLALAGCDRLRTEKPRGCRTNEDCPHGWACLAGTCADTSRKALFFSPEQGVSPAKVKQEVDLQQAKHTRQVEAVMETPQ